MKGKRFFTIEEIKEKSKHKLLAILKRAFQKCLEDWNNAGISVLCLRLVTSYIDFNFGILEIKRFI